MITAIGIIGQGFVGTAVREGMRHALDIWTYDIKHGVVHYTKDSSNKIDENESPLHVVMANTHGPIFVCLPTPMDESGQCNTSIVEDVVRKLDDTAKSFKMARVVCIKSTVPPGTAERLNNECEHIHVCFNPEFLTERNAIEDFKNQDRIIVGGPREGTNILKAMYEMAYPSVPVTKTSSTIAEMVKYVTNVFLAAKVSIANEIKMVCDKLNDVDYDKVVEYATKDKRLGTSHWAVPGPDGKCGFGGSCFPKDLNALLYLANSLGVCCSTLEGAWATNLQVRPEQDWKLLKGRAVTD